jgi:hypothetical protein
MPAIGVTTPTQSHEFEVNAPGGGYWRHAPTGRFSETRCDVGKPCHGLGSHTIPVLRDRLAGQR